MTFVGPEPDLLSRLSQVGRCWQVPTNEGEKTDVQ